MSLVLGRITYANVIPFFHQLAASGFSGIIREGVPAELNRLLASGAIDACPSSSYEYARGWRDYLIFPDLSISSVGPVQSVLLFSRQPLERLDQEEILLSGESATSVRLLEILLREYVGLPMLRCRVPAPQSVEAELRAGATALLIGDRALRARLEHSAGMLVYDLGELWHRFTGLPFVFALWIVRQEAAARQPQALKELQRSLRASLAAAMADLPRLAAGCGGYEWLGPQALAAYWRSVSYGLDPAHQEGLRLYYRLLVKYGMLDAEPPLRFCEPGG